MNIDSWRTQLLCNVFIWCLHIVMGWLIDRFSVVIRSIDVMLYGNMMLNKMHDVWLMSTRFASHKSILLEHSASFVSIWPANLVSMYLCTTWACYMRICHYFVFLFQLSFSVWCLLWRSERLCTTGMVKVMWVLSTLYFVFFFNDDIRSPIRPVYICWWHLWAAI